MLEALLSFYQHILDYSKPWPMAQTALVTTSSLAASGVVLFLLVRAPKAFVNWFKGQFITSLVFSTAATNYSNYNSEQYTAFIKWFAKNAWFNWSRTITIDGESDLISGAVGPGVGNHFMFYKRRFFIVNISEVSVTGNPQARYKLTIMKLGRNKKHLYSLMDEFMNKRDSDSEITAFVSASRDWTWLSRVRKRDIKSIIVTDRVQTDLIDVINDFGKNRQWYEERGLPYKLTILLYGQPGTGKSSLITALASLLDRPIYIMQPGGSLSYQSLFQKASGGIVIVEDIDTYSFSTKRDASELTILEKEQLLRKKKEEEEENPYPEEKDSAEDNESDTNRALSEYLQGSLSEFLNGLDGVLRLDDVIVIMTSNHPEKLDEALVRDGRVDLRVEVEALGDKELRRFFSLCYPGSKPESDEPFLPLPGATAQAVFMKNRFDKVAFERALREKGDNIVLLNKVA